MKFKLLSNKTTYSNSIRINKNTLSIISMIFIYIPIFLFLFGFIKWYLAFITALGIGYGFYQFSKDIMARNAEYIELSKKTLAVCFVICLAIGSICGWGGLFAQASDWHKTNAILRDLINSRWPVYFVNGSEKAALSYYIAGYLLPAFVGKAFHSFRTAELFMLLYFSLGLFLLVLNAFVFLKISEFRKTLVFLLGMFLFSGALLLADHLIYLLYPKINSIGSNWVRGEGLLLQYRPIVTCLRWVPNQFIFPCLIGMVLINYRNIVQHYVWLMLPALFYSGFAFVGMVPIALGITIFNVIKKEISLKDILSLSNILMTLTLGFIFIFYFLGNITSEKPANMAFTFVNYGGGRLLGVYVIFCFLTFGIYCIILWKRNRGNPVFLSIVAVLLVLPFEKLGMNNDWVMGCSMIPIFFLMLFVWEFLFYDKTNDFGKVILVVILCIGTIYPIMELRNTMKTTAALYKSTEYLKLRADSYGTMRKYANRSSKEKNKSLIYNYFTYDLDNDIFYRFIAKNRLKNG